MNVLYYNVTIEIAQYIEKVLSPVMYIDEITYVNTSRVSPSVTVTFALTVSLSLVATLV